MKTIAICSSAAFYKDVCEIAKVLEGQGYFVSIPETARKMQLSGNYNVEEYKTWYKNSDDFSEKSRLMLDYFETIANSDIVLVVNNQKNEVKGYIGPNVLMEIGLAFYLGKKVFLKNSIEKDSSYYEEIIGMGCIDLKGDLSKINSL